MKRYLLLLLLFTALSGYTQNTINNYKYILVPEQFSFFKEVNKYGLNNLTRKLLEEKGFTVYFDNENLPVEIAANKCKAMTADLTEKKGMFTTRLTLILKDCQGNVVFKGEEGKSKEKDFTAAYQEALQNAFISFNELPYAFSGDVQMAEIVKAPEVVAAPANQQAAGAETTEPSGTLYAQVTTTGFQLVDTTPKKMLTLFKTSVENCFIAEGSQHKGMVVKKDGKWFFEYYNNDKLIIEELLIKF